MSFTTECGPTVLKKVDPGLLPKIGQQVCTNGNHRAKLTTRPTRNGKVTALNNPLVQIDGGDWINVHWLEWTEL